MQHEPVETKGVTDGFDCQSEIHIGAVLKQLGRLRGKASFATTSDGFRRVTGWLRSFGPVIAVGVDSTGSFGAALAGMPNEQGVRTIGANQPHLHARSRRGKTDAIDAEAVTRNLLFGETTAATKNTRGLVEAIRQLTVARGPSKHRRRPCVSWAICW